VGKLTDLAESVKFKWIMHKPTTEQEARQMLSRLERMSVDSAWARRASGVRGGLLKMFAELEAGLELDTERQVRLNQLADHAYELLVRAARELRGQDPLDKA
jgi:hypothetical protein